MLGYVEGLGSLEVDFTHKIQNDIAKGRKQGPEAEKTNRKPPNYNFVCIFFGLID